MSAKGTRPGKKPGDAPEILNRRARHDYFIEDTLEVGIKLVGTEVRSIRAGKCSIAEGYVRAEAEPARLLIYGMHVDEYGPAGPPASGRQHTMARSRTLLAHAREIRKLASASSIKGVTIVPLKLYFKAGRAKLLIGVARGKQAFDKRQTIKTRETQREIRRELSRRV